LSNIFSGISVILDKSVRVNDLIYLGTDAKGKILKVGLRSTKIRTFDNELIIVPNNKLADSMIQNVALPDPKTRATVPFSVAYGSNIEKVKKIVLKELKTISDLDESENLVVRFIEMGDSSLIFKAYFYVDSFDNKWKAIDEANTKIYNALNKNGISIPFPQMDVHLTKKFINKLGVFDYHHVKDSLFVGFRAIKMGNSLIYKASKAKALFDFLYLRKNILLCREAVTELRLNLENFNLKEIKEFKKYINLEGSKKMKEILKYLFRN